MLGRKLELVVHPVNKHQGNIEMKNYYVEVNKIIVGKVSQSEVDSIRQAVRSDWRIWYLQTTSVARALFQFMRFAVYMLVCICTVGVLLTAYFDPQSLSTLLSEMAGSPDVVKQAASSMLNMWFVLCVVMLGAAIATQTTFGLTDEFANAVASRLRERLDVPADGSVRWWLESSQAKPLSF